MIGPRKHPHLRSAVKTYPYLTAWTAVAATISMGLQVWQLWQGVVTR